jgi:hypothetical protein
VEIAADKTGPAVCSAVAAELFEIVQVGDFDQAYLVALGGGLVEL